jgi:cytidylate kinase
VEGQGPSRRRGLIIAVDGPSGVGKSTTCMALARRLGYRYIDTGAMYRSVAFEAERKGVPVEDRHALEELCEEMRIAFHEDHSGVRIVVDGQEVSHLIRTPGIGEKASRVSRIPEVRRIMVQRQREIGKDGAVVMEGRDIGSVVFPDADVKIFLDAAPEERARRRYREWLEKGLAIPEDEVFKEIQARDHRDTTRDTAPLQIPQGAVRIDTTHLLLDEVVRTILRIIEEKRHGQID